jgi:hypothetical protein
MTLQNLWDSESETCWTCFTDARDFARSLDLNNRGEWDNYIAKEKPDLPDRPVDIPPDPDIQYRFQGWVSWEDWLGISTDDEILPDNESKSLDLFEQHPEESPWLEFNEARAFARDQGFEYKEEWDVYCKGLFPEREALPGNIPVNPDYIYRHKGWKNWRDWLISPENNRVYSAYPEAREFIRCFRYNNKNQYRDLVVSFPDDYNKYNILLPEKPDLEYKESGWSGWDDFLCSNVDYLSYEDTRRFIHTLKLESVAQWKNYCKGQLIHLPIKLDNIFTYPEIGYKDKGWSGWEDWLGINPNCTNSENDKTSIKDCRCRGRIKDCPVCDGKGYLETD